MNKFTSEFHHGARALRRFIFPFLTSTIFVLGGCAVADFMGAYFNTYYNAQKLFQEAETEVLTAPVNSPGRQTSFGGEEPYLSQFQVPAQSKTKFTAVIEKCSKLLQYHPNSSLVDDALLMIGKSYFYQNEYQSAERKFKELLTSYPESDLAFEARFLLAQTYFRMKDIPLATSTARELLDAAREADESDIRSKAAELLGAIELQNKNPNAALEYFVEAGEHAEAPEARAASYRRAAALYVERKDFDRALEMYVKSRKAGNTYISEFRGELGRAQMLSRLGKHEEALEILDDLITNTNYKEFFGEIDFEIGNVYRNMGDIEAAERQYRYVDTAYARSEVAANSYYQLGRLYETQLANFDSANIAYNTGKLQYQSALIQPELVKRSELMTKYITYRNEILKYDSIKTYIINRPATADSGLTVRDTAAFTDTTLALSDTLSADSLLFKGPPAEAGVKFAMKRNAEQMRDSALVKEPPVPPPPMDTVQARLAYNLSEMASLFYSGFGNIDSAKGWYKRLVEEHPESRYAARGLYTLAKIYTADSSMSPGQIDSLYREIVKRFPDTEFAAESRRLLGLPAPTVSVDSLELRYRSAESLIKKGEAQAAIGELRRLAVADTLSPVAAKSQYAIGWIYEHLKQNPDSSIVNYKTLVARYPSSQYAASVRPKLQEAEAFRQQQLEAARRDSAAAATKQAEEKKATQKPDEKSPQPPPQEKLDEVAPAVPDTSAKKEELLR